MTECRNCHAQREMAVRCPDCGTKPSPSEVNTALVERRKLLDDIRAVLAQPPSHVGPEPDAQRLLDSTGDLFMAIVLAFGRAVQRQSVLPLDAALRDYQTWALRVDLLDRIRPHIGAHDALQVARENLRRLVDAYLVALGAPDIATAQKQQAVISQTIAEAAQAVTEVTDMSARVTNLTNESPADVLRDSLHIQLNSSGLSPHELFSWMEKQVERELETNSTQSIAMDVMTFQFLLGSVIDTANFWQLLKAAFNLFSRGQWLDAALESDRFMRDFQNSRIGLASRTWISGQSISAALTNPMAIDQLGQLTRDIVEGAGSFCSRVLLLASGRKTASYDRLFTQNGTEHIAQAQKLPDLRDFVCFLDLPLRTASAHGGIQVDALGLVATSKQHGTHSYSVARLSNIALGALEQTMAVLLALRLVLDHRGIEVDDSELHAFIGLSPLRLTEITAEVMWGQRTHIELNASGDIRVEATGSHRENLLLLLAQVAVQAAPDSEHFEVHHSDQEGTRVLSGLSAALRQLDGKDVRDEPLAAVSYLEAVEQLQLNGAPFLSEARRRLWCANVAIQALTAANQDLAAFRSWGPVLRRVRAVAERAQDAELIDALRSCMRFVRSGEFSDGLRTQLRTWIDSPDGNLP